MLVNICLLLQWPTRCTVIIKLFNSSPRSENLADDPLYGLSYNMAFGSDSSDDAKANIKLLLLSNSTKRRTLALSSLEQRIQEKGVYIVSSKRNQESNRCFERVQFG
jgi:hypothetical protein